MKSKKMIKKFKAFEVAQRELNEAWQEYGTDKFGEDYPFNSCFSEMTTDVIKWCATSIRDIKETTFKDMQKTRRVMLKTLFEDDNDIATDFEDCRHLFVYFDSFYIGITNAGEFRVLYGNSEEYHTNLQEAEKEFWEELLKDELNHEK